MSEMYGALKLLASLTITGVMLAKPGGGFSDQTILFMAGGISGMLWMSAFNNFFPKSPLPASASPE